ncbi:hypothetical protein [Streptomyces sp. NBC_01092]|uniref:hypothetical protein n=1 Tax=Streptomyces sp. NBC_01092 TaxID=2903748 RepID=UPI00386B0905|nr:hypothetical protein OG254_39865 [Streptomyces sp. NBC_01092]
MSGAGDGTRSRRRLSAGEIAALVSAATAVVGLLLALFGVPLIGGSSPGRPVVDGAAAPARSATPDASATPEAFPSIAVPSGWRRVGAPDLRATFALPDDWTKDFGSGTQSNWSSPDEEHAMSLKRDSSYGPTPKAAVAGQLQWYRDPQKSSMADLKVATHPTRQNGKEALLLEIDYHYTDQSAPRKRVEVFVAGKAGQVYQLLFDTVATRERPAAQKHLFATARAHLLIDTSVR